MSMRLSKSNISNSTKLPHVQKYECYHKYTPNH